MLAKLTRYQDLISHQIEKNNFEVLNMLNAKYFIFNDTTVQSKTLKHLATAGLLTL